MKLKIDEGVYSVLMTSFNKDNNVEDTDIFYLLKNHDNSNITGYVVLGTTSETSTLSHEEKIDIIKFIESNTMKKIVVGLGGNNTNEMLKYADSYTEYADYVMISSPYYNKPSQEGLYQHFKLLSQKVKKPVILYNVPSRTGVNIEVSTIKRLYNDIDNIVAIKEASGDINQIMRIKKECDIQIFSGDDLLTIPIMCLGGSGVISVYSNIYPHIMVNIYKLCKENKYDEARILFYDNYDKIKSLFIDTNPICGKYILYKLGIFTSDMMRLPLTQLDEDNKKIIDNLYKF